MISQNADDWNGGLRQACRGGHRKLVELMVHNGADDWNGALEAACKGCHKEIIELMIINGATNVEDTLKQADDEIIKLWISRIVHKTK